MLDRWNARLIRAAAVQRSMGKRRETEAWGRWRRRNTRRDVGCLCHAVHILPSLTEVYFNSELQYTAFKRSTYSFKELALPKNGV